MAFLFLAERICGPQQVAAQFATIVVNFAFVVADIAVQASVTVPGEGRCYTHSQ